MRRQLQIGRTSVQPLPLALLLLVAAFAAVTSPSVLLMLAPALAIFGLLFAGRTPGERLLLRLRRRRGAPSKRRRGGSMPVARHVAPFVRALQRMSASALAMRPPPAAVAIVV